MSSSRQLAAILFTDIVGYTALMQQDEQKAVALIKHYSSALDKIVTSYEGKVLNYAPLVWFVMRSRKGSAKIDADRVKRNSTDKQLIKSNALLQC